MENDVVGLARALIDIDSTTGLEAQAGEWLAACLRDRGFHVTEQPVEGERFNVLATCGEPVVVLSTHMDCVPPFFPSRVEGDRLFGRGAADAKGILAAQLVAAERLRARGEERCALLFLVGEERGSDGARAANEHSIGNQYFINGEPTDNRLATATRGLLRVKLKARGRAAHSSLPQAGESAIDTLIDALIRLRGLPLPDDRVLGRTFYTVALITGGVAPNVVPPEAEAEVSFRTVGDGGRVLEALKALDTVDCQKVLEVPPIAFETIAGFETAVFPFTTDAGFLPRWGRPFLLGPGSALLAHTADEHVALAELTRAVDLYVSLATALLAGEHDRLVPG